jgi:Zn-dependent peptidase ImmA (M78 family)/DNA-binding XRE family transcriptional regulator
MQNHQEHFNPEMLVLARQSRGISQRELARILSVSPGWLSKIEGGIKELPDDRLSKIAELLDYPMEFFTSNKRIFGPGVSELFHRKRHNIPMRILDKHQAQIEIRRMNIADLLDGVEIGGLGIRTYDLYEFNGNVQDIARTIRATWQMPRGPVRNVTEAIEYVRGIVIPVDFETKLIDATSCWPPNMPPLFFVNTNAPTDRLRFSLCHELGHIIMHQDNPNPYMEHQANEFAAEFLMPEHDISPYLMNVSLEKLATLKPYWKVSMAAILQRAKDLGEITPRHAKTLWIQLGKAGYRVREPVELDIPVETPTLLQEIIGTYSKEMDYTFPELAKLLRLHEHEICHIYFGAKSDLKDEEAEAAIREAEHIIASYRKQ